MGWIPRKIDPCDALWSVAANWRALPMADSTVLSPCPSLIRQTSPSGRQNSTVSMSSRSDSAFAENTMDGALLVIDGLGTRGRPEPRARL